MSIMADPKVTGQVENAAIEFAEWVWGIIIHPSVKGDGYYVVREEDNTTNIRTMKELYYRWLHSPLPTINKCPFCGGEDLFSFKLIHCKCRECKEQFTN